METLEAMSDDDIDFSDIPESLDWSDAIHNAYELLQKGEPLPKRRTDPEEKTHDAKDSNDQRENRLPRPPQLPLKGRHPCR